MIRPLRNTFAVLATLVSFSSAAWADGRITGGAVIPLDPTKASDPAIIKSIISSCFYEVAMKGMFPELSNVESNAATKKTFRDNSVASSQRSVSGTITKTSANWEAALDSNLQFNETLSDGTTKKRYLALALQKNYTEIFATVRTDFKDLALSDYFTLPLPLSQLQVVSTSEKTCGMNNWGRERCVETPPVMSAVNLVVPTNFVAGAYWKNYYTGVETQKRFDYFDYADCVLWKWEN